MRSLFVVSLVSTLLVSTLHASAQSDDADMRTRFAIKGILGSGGEVETDTNVEVTVPGVGTVMRRGTVGDDLDSTVGLGLVFEAPFHDYVTAGVILALQSWNSDGRGDNNVDPFKMFDLDGFIKVRLPTHIDSMGFEPYVMLPLGFSANFTSDDDADEIGTGVGWNTGLLLGAVLFVGDSIGLSAEIGAAMHSVTHEVDVNGSNRDFDLNVTQGRFNLGVVFALD